MRYLRKTTFAAAAVIITLATALARAQDPPEPDDADLAAVVAGNNAFAFDLYRTLSQGTDDNLFFSPYSISTALAMTYAGARGNTAMQMAETLHFTLPQDSIHSAMGSVIAALNGEQRQGYELSVANRLWGQQGYSFVPEFLETTREHYGAPLAELDFFRQPEPARVIINQWVEDETNERIQDLIPRGMITPGTRLVLTNAIYFQGDWQYQFDSDHTRPSSFSVSADQQVEIPMMHQQSRFNYGSFPECQILEMPYAGEDLSMFAVLPREEDGLAELEQWLTAETLQQSIEQMRSRKVSMFLPKFEITSEFDLKEALSSMGMPSAFTSEADFSGITTAEGLKIDSVIHEAFLQLDEEGAEAAAATAVIIGSVTTSINTPPPVFRADHPFLFFLRDNQTESILFMGRVVEPKPTEQASVPEPSILILLLVGIAGLVAYVWRRPGRPRQRVPGGQIDSGSCRASASESGQSSAWWFAPGCAAGEGR